MAFSLSNITSNIGLLAGVSVGVIVGGALENYLANSSIGSSSPYAAPLIEVVLGFVLAAFDNPLLAGIGYGLVGYGVWRLVKSLSGGSI